MFRSMLPRVVLASALMIGAGLAIPMAGCLASNSAMTSTDPALYLPAQRQDYATKNDLYVATVETMTTLAKAGVINAEDARNFERVRSTAASYLVQYEQAITAGQRFAQLPALTTALELLTTQAQAAKESSNAPRSSHSTFDRGASPEARACGDRPGESRPGPDPGRFDG